jgi:threonine dehydratase
MIPGVLDILAARRRIAGHVYATPLRESAWLTSHSGAPVYLKLECVQRTGSFKLRGAFNALARLGPAEADPSSSDRPSRVQHVVTASAGNHGRAIALAAETLGLQATVFAPRDAPTTKLAAIERHGAELRREPTYDDAERAARALAHAAGLTFVSPYNHADVIAGAGTIALEVIEAFPDVATIVVPVGGGGLIAGVALAAKAIAPRARIIGVEVAASCAMLTSLQNGRITNIEPRPTLADGLAGNLEPGSMTFEIVRQHVDEIVTVGEEELAAGMCGLVAHEHVVAEGAGAAAVAALAARKIKATGTVVALVTGGNIDLRRLAVVLREHPDQKDDGRENQHGQPDHTSEAG